VVRLGERATARTRGLVQGKSIAWEVPEGTPLFDPYDRMLAYVELPGGGEDLGERLLREGLAEPRRDRHPRSDRYRAAAAPLAW
jgi:endonuclease YncB( thermonuclease family)